MESPLHSLDGQQIDVCLLGGGISGCATARELARRGFRVLLIEPRGLAWGTSGRSSRLIHGGLRYLAGGHLKLVRKSLRARYELVRAAPHLVRPCPFVIPRTKADPLSWRLAAPWGVRLYEFLARPRRGWPNAHRLSREQVQTLIPDFDPGGFRDALTYYDGLTDDRRLTAVTALDATRSGATIATRCEVVSASPASGSRVALQVRDCIGGELVEVQARCVINATGPWVDRTRSQLGVDGPQLVRPTRGAHLVVEGRIGAAALLKHPKDRRVVFLVPAGERFLVGTTDDDDTRRPDEIRATESDCGYLRQLMSFAFPTKKFAVRTTWAGLRPLVASPGDPDDVSRKDRLIEERLGDAPLLTVVGGKLTLHRMMARRAAARVEQLLGSAQQGPRPEHLPGGDIASVPGEEAAVVASGLDGAQARWLIARYGSQWNDVLSCTDNAALPLGDAPYPFVGDIEWAVRWEGRRTLSDVLLSLHLPELVDDDSHLAEAAHAYLTRRESWSSARADREWQRWLKEREAVYGGGAMEAQPAEL